MNIMQYKKIPTNDKGQFHGHYIGFTIDGKLQSIRNYLNGRIVAHIKEIFPDGKCEEGYIVR